MNRNEKLKRLRDYLKRIAPDQTVETLADRPVARSAFESTESAGFDAEVESAQRGIRKLAQDVPDDRIADQEIHAMEAIILPRERPVVFIQNGSYSDLPAPWSHFGNAAIRSRIESAIPAIGRVELPGSLQIPYAGTGFVVGWNLLMTNRHVAELFASGLGRRGLMFRPGQTSALNFRREKGDADDDQRSFAQVRDVAMIHPYWDMALLRVDTLPLGVRPLMLSTRAPEDLAGRDVGVIGYPARDARNDLDLQDRIFERTYYVKRLHPGKLRERNLIASFGNSVNAMTHDSSTLGGNSGSAIVDAGTGEIVGLHFAGIYLKANYAVPTYELARDSRVVDAGLNFQGQVAATQQWAAAWRLVEQDERVPTGDGDSTTAVPNQIAPSGGVTLKEDGATATWVIPLQVSVTLAMPTPAAAAVSPSQAGLGVIEALRIPIMHGNLEARTGYQARFLELPEDDEIPIPELTEAGENVVARLDDGGHVLNYHKFSVVVHKTRRLALLTASNVDWRESSRLINGHKPSRRELTGLGPNDREQWVTDERIPDAHQLPDVFFTKDGGAFDKGHLVRRDDVCWGPSFADIQMANGDTYHTTNCSPQVASFNQSQRGEDNWGDLENLIQQQTKAERAIVFSGPVLADDDPVFAGRDKRGNVRIQIPRIFWKIIVVKGDAGPEAYGFTLEQDLAAVPTEFVVPAQWKRYLRKISKIERLLNSLVKLRELKRIDQFETSAGQTLQQRFPTSA